MSCTTSCQKKPTTANNNACYDRMSMGLTGQTSWETNCAMYFKMQKENTGQSSYEQRQWLQNNAERLINEARDKANMPSCAPCSIAGKAGSTLPEDTLQKCNEVACTYSKANFGEGITGMGVGGRGHVGN